MSEKTNLNTVDLYRIENPIHPNPNEHDSIISHEDLVGQWFSPNLSTALCYLRKSTQTFGKKAAPVEGARMVIAHVPEADLGQYHVSHHPVASSMDVENDNYIVPTNGDVETETIPLDDVIGDLRGKLGNYNNLSEAKRRIENLFGQTATN